MPKLLIFCVFLLLTSCNLVDKKEEVYKGYTINGALPHTTNAALVYLINGENKKIDSSKVINNTFHFKGFLTQPEIYQLQVRNQREKHTIILENSHYTVVLNDDNTIVSGGNLNTRQLTFNNLQNRLNTEKLTLLDKFMLGEITSDLLQKSVQELEVEKKKITTDYVISNANNLLSNTLFLTTQNFSLEELKNLVNNTEISKTTILKSVLVEEIKRLEKIVEDELAKTIKIAQANKIYRKPAIMFSGDGLNRELISLESIIKGKKLVLIDFWASWCGPCRMTMPKVRELYHTYKNKGFTILTVSEDKNREDWKKGIEQDQMLSWHHIFDDFGRISTMYGVKTIPYMVLIDGNGGIIKEKISITELEYQLQKLL
ncbi:TlpA disulfide reductase family protein [Polaribacter atrinae]|uniref:TlpA disulfide reductase family protein n=1 Tax=Polaribacter atrinae TaxID=1333662 RepID=UPI00248F5144|nr:TlpA disulfide reductase family protein [Polaribacter atrinae]